MTSGTTGLNCCHLGLKTEQDPAGAFDAECHRNCQCASRMWSLCQCDTRWAYLVWNHSRMRNWKSDFAKWKIYTDVEWVKVAQLFRLIAIPWTLQSMEFSRPDYWSGQPFPSPGDLPNPGIEPTSPALQADSLPAEPQASPYGCWFLAKKAPEVGMDFLVICQNFLLLLLFSITLSLEW